MSRGIVTVNVYRPDDTKLGAVRTMANCGGDPHPGDYLHPYCDTCGDCVICYGDVCDRGCWLVAYADMPEDAPWMKGNATQTPRCDDAPSHDEKT